jgi:hypothetical protein
MELAERFVGGDTDGGGEIEGAERMIAEAREGEAVYLELLVERFRATVPFVAEEKRITRAEGGVPERGLGMGGKEPDPLWKEGRILKGLPGRMEVNIEVLPVVHATSAQVAVLERKAKGPDKVQPRVSESAQTADVTRVLRNFWLI